MEEIKKYSSIELIDCRGFKFWQSVDNSSLPGFRLNIKMTAQNCAKTTDYMGSP